METDALIRLLREEIYEAKRFEVLGRVASQMAHDFNNLVQAVISHAQVLELEGIAETEKRDSATELRRAAEQAGMLAGYLLNFRQIDRPEMTEIDLNALTSEGLDLFQRSIGKNVVLKCALSGSPCRVMADRRHLERVLFQILSNASDATSGRGTISVTTAVRDLDATPDEGCLCVQPGPYAVLSVQDNGSGMSDEIRERVFEPFFTTKEPSPGKGLGLCFVKAIVTRHKGHIHIESRSGTLVQIFLPLLEGEATGALPER